ncbi:hypothetical protein K438DRAFT_1748864 [Mycena galopus ATCC 62051]|nr:hypothetical protein K438DRAFT_1748864 [Mycena galopus ATCC 62051]
MAKDSGGDSGMRKVLRNEQEEGDEVEKKAIDYSKPGKSGATKIFLNGKSDETDSGGLGFHDGGRGVNKFSVGHQDRTPNASASILSMSELQTEQTGNLCGWIWDIHESETPPTRRSQARSTPARSHTEATTQSNEIIISAGGRIPPDFKLQALRAELQLYNRKVKPFFILSKNTAGNTAANDVARAWKPPGDNLQLQIRTGTQTAANPQKEHSPPPKYKRDGPAGFTATCMDLATAPAAFLVTTHAAYDSCRRLTDGGVQNMKDVYSKEETRLRLAYT